MVGSWYKKRGLVYAMLCGGPLRQVSVVRRPARNFDTILTTYCWPWVVFPLEKPIKRHIL